MDVMLIFDVVIAIFGVYMMGAALKMKKDREDQLGGHHGGGDCQMQKNEGVHNVYLLERGSIRRIDYRCGCPWNYQ